MKGVKTENRDEEGFVIGVKVDAGTGLEAN